MFDTKDSGTGMGWVASCGIITGRTYKAELAGPSEIVVMLIEIHA